VKRFPLVLLFLFIQPAAWAASAPTSRPAPLSPNAFSVLAHADDRQIWLGQVNQYSGIPGALNTAIYYRQIGQDQHWQLLTRVQARVIEMSSQGSTAGLLMEDGSWSLLYTDGTLVTAGPLPSPARMVALAGGRNTWWAVGEVVGGISGVPTTSRAGATTGPSTRKSAAAVPQPQSRPADVRLVLFKLNGNDWDAISELPGQLPEVSHLSLVLADDTPYLADLDRNGALQVRYLENNRWVTDLHLEDAEPVTTFALLNDQPPVRLWVDRPTGDDQVFTIGSKAKPIGITSISGSAPGGRTMVMFAGKLRMFARAQEKLVEQDYAVETGKIELQEQPVPLPGPSPLLDLQSFQAIVVIASFVAIVFGWYRRQMEYGEAMPQPELSTLAPLGRRFLAGLIDASPVVLTVIFTAVRDANTSGMPAQQQELVLWLAYWAAGLFYILYTTLVESLAGRSLGKILLGLRVVGLDGKPATPTALIVRNVLRIFDVGCFFVPVMIVGMSSLRQRPGDAAAGTVVVRGEQGLPEEEKESKSGEASDSKSQSK